MYVLEILLNMYKYLTKNLITKISYNFNSKFRTHKLKCYYSRSVLLFFEAQVWVKKKKEGGGGGVGGILKGSQNFY